MGHCITSILLSTRRLGPSKLNDFLTNDEAELAGLRTTAAIRAVDVTTEYLKLPGHSPFSEPAAYALFLSTLCLTMSTDRDNDTRALLNTKIQVAFLLMNRIACPMHAASSVYIHYIMVSFCKSVHFGRLINLCRSSAIFITRINTTAIFYRDLLLKRLPQSVVVQH